MYIRVLFEIAWREDEFAEIRESEEEEEVWESGLEEEEEREEEEEEERGREWGRGRGSRIAGGKSHPRCASGTCSVYLKNPFITSIPKRTVPIGGRTKTASRVVGRACGREGVYDRCFRRSAEYHQINS